jgi:hypothetical protein
MKCGKYGIPFIVGQTFPGEETVFSGSWEGEMGTGRDPCSFFVHLTEYLSPRRIAFTISTATVSIFTDQAFRRWRKQLMSLRHAMLLRAATVNRDAELVIVPTVFLATFWHISLPIIVTITVVVGQRENQKWHQSSCTMTTNLHRNWWRPH